MSSTNLKVDLSNGHMKIVHTIGFILNMDMWDQRKMYDIELQYVWYL